MPLIRKDTPTPSTGSPGNPLAGLTSASEEDRWAAARQLTSDPASVGPLGDALTAETFPRVRAAILTSLAHIKTPEAIKAILPHIRSNDAGVRAATLDALGSIAGAAEAYLPQLLADPDPDVRLLVCEVVRRLPAETATKYLCNLLGQEQEPNVCGAAIEALSEVGDRSALPILAKCAERFEAEPFLQFSINAVSKRIAGDGRASEPEGA